ncbi:hypothetical protein GIB67_034324 [Kingdonia uniflora]|uniref:Uncharacterized protein n=1 Tax=Kingdonia uniflora TaxID=39325 RepID=A0A7J7NSI4_9MAGN|nr:hypothetical protein GIB67_034324 [Kingdonia uniflora]
MMESNKKLTTSNKLMMKQIKAMLVAVMAIPARVTSSEVVGDEVEGSDGGSSRGRGRDLPMGAFMRDGRNTGINPMNPTPLRVVRRGKKTIFGQNQVERFDSKGERTHLYNSFAGLNVDVENIDKFADSRDVDGLIDPQGLRRTMPNPNDELEVGDGLGGQQDKSERSSTTPRQGMGMPRVEMGTKGTSQKVSGIRQGMPKVGQGTRGTGQAKAGLEQSMPDTCTGMPRQGIFSAGMTHVREKERPDNPQSPPRFDGNDNRNAANSNNSSGVDSDNARNQVVSGAPPTSSIPTRGFDSQISHKDSGMRFRSADRNSSGYTGNVSGHWRSNEHYSGGQLSMGATPYVPPRPQRPLTPPQGPRYSGQSNLQRQWTSGNSFVVLIESEAQWVSRFRLGLTKRIQDEMILFSPQSLSEIMEMASQADQDVPVLQAFEKNYAVTRGSFLNLVVEDMAMGWDQLQILEEPLECHTISVVDLKFIWRLSFKAETNSEDTDEVILSVVNKFARTLGDL